MKKFNSILAIATVALTSVFGFTSCDKNDDAISQVMPCPDDTPLCTLKVSNDYDRQSTPSEVKAVTAKDLAGTYKYTDEEGKEWTIEMTENSCEGQSYYCASITVPEGYGVDAKTYDGKFLIGYKMATFHTYDKTGATYCNSIASFGFDLNKDNLKNATVYLKLKGEDFGTVVFVKQ